MSTLAIKVSDIGYLQDVENINVLVDPGDPVSVETPLYSLESDKSSLEIPSPSAGSVKKIQIKLGDGVSNEHLILDLK